MAFLKYRGSTITPGTWSANAAAGAPLTNLDIDKNFASLDAQKLDLSGGTISGALAIGQNLTAEFKDDQVSFVDGADTSKKLAFQLSGITTSTTKTLTIPNNDGTIALTSDIGNGALTISAVATAATSNTVTLELSGAYSANTSTARTLDLKVGPALTALATLMTTAGAGFIRRGAAADTYAIDTNTYSTTAHGHFIGTTAVQSSAANQALTGITGLSTPNSATTSSAITITSGLGTASSSTSGGVTISTGTTNGTVSTGASSGALRLETGTSGTNGGAGSITLAPGITGGSGSNNSSIYLYGGNSTNGTFSDNGHIYIKAGSATAATGTKSGGKVWIDGGRTATGGTVVDDGQVNIGTEVGSPGGSGTAVVNIGHASATTNIRGTVNVLSTTASTTTATGALIVSGGVGVAGTVNAADFNSTSDIRFKKDLEKISNALSKVKQLTGYTYTLIETNTRSTGLIAQDVEEILPESVGGDDNKKTLSYGSMMGLIVEAIKELNAKVEDLQNQLMNK
jgi:hypothetical protein